MDTLRFRNYVNKGRGIMSTAILACGNMRHGKDTVIGFIKEFFAEEGVDGYLSTAFASPIKALVHALFGLHKIGSEKDSVNRCVIDRHGLRNAEEVYKKFGFDKKSTYMDGYVVIPFSTYIIELCAYMGLPSPNFNCHIVTGGEVVLRLAYQFTGDDFGRFRVAPDIWCRLMSKPEFAFITDLRRCNELEYIRSKYDRVIVIKVYNPHKSSGCLVHSSEREMALIDPDHLLINDKGLVELRDGVFCYFRTISLVDRIH